MQKMTFAMRFIFVAICVLAAEVHSDAGHDASIVRARCRDVVNLGWHENWFIELRVFLEKCSETPPNMLGLLSGMPRVALPSSQKQLQAKINKNPRI